MSSQIVTRLNKVLFTVSVKFLVLLMANFSIIRRIRKEKKLLRCRLKEGP